MERLLAKQRPAQPKHHLLRRLKQMSPEAVLSQALSNIVVKHPSAHVGKRQHRTHTSLLLVIGTRRLNGGTIARCKTGPHGLTFSTGVPTSSRQSCADTLADCEWDGF